MFGKKKIFLKKKCFRTVLYQLKWCEVPHISFPLTAFLRMMSNSRSLPMPESRNPSSRFAEALAFLESRINYEKIAAFTVDEMAGRLDRLRSLLALLGHPHHQYRTVHVAGTKGKGSTCALLQSILLEAGLKVGCFTSPHLDSITERFAIGGIPCPDEVFAEELFELVDRVRQCDATLADEMTYFEWTTVLAFVYFAKEQVDVAIFEVGLGGRFDATNICRSDVTVVTSISYDHMEQLGPTLEEITSEKGGIIKPGVPLVSGVLMPEPLRMLRDMARSQNATAYFLGDGFSICPAARHAITAGTNREAFRFETKLPFLDDTFHCGPLSLRLPGPHQRRNAALALMAALLLHAVDARFPADPDTLQRGLEKVTLPGRIEILPQGENRPIFVVDGAHNRASVRALIQTVRETFPHHRLHLVFGISMGKDAEGMLTDIVRGFDHIVLTQYSTNPRRFPPQGLRTILSSIPDAPDRFREEFGGPSFVFPESGETLHLDAPPEIEIIDDCREALRSCWNGALPGDVVCVSGSMFLAAELRREFLDEYAGKDRE